MPGTGLKAILGYVSAVRWCLVHVEVASVALPLWQKTQGEAT